MNTGGPAFPVIYDVPQEEEQHIYTGMTLRDYFAAKAMAMMYQSYVDDLAKDGERFKVGNPTKPGVSAEGLAWEAYAMADAMLQARGF